VRFYIFSLLAELKFVYQPCDKSGVVFTPARDDRWSALALHNLADGKGTTLNVLCTCARTIQYFFKLILSQTFQLQKTSSTRTQA
jgi:hypothetical protein